MSNEQDEPDYDGVTLPIMCNVCGCLFDFHPGDEPETDLCPACRPHEPASEPATGG